jgi:hypothetical protein
LGHLPLVSIQISGVNPQVIKCYCVTEVSFSIHIFPGTATVEPTSWTRGCHVAEVLSHDMQLVDVARPPCKYIPHTWQLNPQVKLGGVVTHLQHLQDRNLEVRCVK